METPIYNFVKKYACADFSRFHMPGHKGRVGLSAQFDITEIKGADSLFEAEGIIKESEENASLLFDTQKTIYSAQGSTTCIYTMLSLAVSGVEKPYIIAVRNVHKAFINACALLDIDVGWVFPNYEQGSIASGEYNASDIEKAILDSDIMPCAVYLTSPDYLGRIADVKLISEMCERYGILLLVDNAHGTYLNFLKENIHPITLGADMCCDSAHKTLPVLTGGAYLHISKKTYKRFSDNAKQTMSIFSSTSPSYLILSSLDLCNKYLDEEIKDKLRDTVAIIDKLKKRLVQHGYCVCDGEPLKLTIFTHPSGMTGTQLADILRESRIECEYADYTHIVFMFSTSNTADEINALGDVITKVRQPRIRLERPLFDLQQPKKAISIRNAVFSESEEIETESSEGRVCSKVVVACPPGIPVVVSGEIINSNIIKNLKRYSILKVNVVKLK